MAITRSAKKAHRQSLRKGQVNDALKKKLRDAFKGVRQAKAGDQQAIAAAYKAIDKAAKKGLIKKNTANRRKSLVTRMAKVK